MINKKYQAKDIVNLCIGLIIMCICGRICPLWGSVSRLGAEGIFIFAGGIWLVSSGFGLIVPCMLIMLAMIVSGYTDGTSLIASTLGSSNVWQLLIIFVLLYAVTESKADQVIARWLISRKSLNGRPVLFTCVFMLAVTILAMLAGSLGAFLFSVTMINSIGQTVGYDDDTQWKRYMIAGALIMSSVGGGILPFKGLALLIYGLIESGLANANVPINYMSYLASAALSGCFISLTYALSIRHIFRVDYSRLANVDIASICSEGGIRFNIRQLVTLVMFFLGITYPIITNMMPDTFPEYARITAIGQGFWFAFMCCILALLHIDGKPLLDINEAFHHSVNWGVVISVCAFTAIGGMIADKELGIRDWLFAIIEGLISEVSFPIFVLLIVVVTLVCTNFFSNTATAVIIGTLVSPFCAEYGLSLGVNISCIIPAIVMSALCAFLTMGAGGSAPIFLGLECMQNKPRWIWQYSIPIFLIVALPSWLAYTICAYLL